MTHNNDNPPDHPSEDPNRRSDEAPDDDRTDAHVDDATDAHAEDSGSDGFDNDSADAPNDDGGNDGFDPNNFDGDPSDDNGFDGDGFDDDDDDDGDEPREALSMTLWEHLEELRWVILKTAIVFVIFGTGIAVFAVAFKSVLDWPLYQGAALVGEAAEPLRTRDPMEVFVFILQLVFFGALGLTLPFAVYFLAGFVAPGLTARERALLRPVCLALLALFFAGCAFSFFLVLPTMIAVSYKMNAMFGFEMLWAPGPYYSAVVWLTIGMGLIFEFPLVLVVIQYLEIIEPDTLRDKRRYAFVILLILAALLTPTGDPITLFLVALPMYGLYEAAIKVGQIILNKRAEAEAKAEA